MIRRLAAWVRKYEFQFKRVHFYRDLIRSVKRDEVLQKFLVGELTIARASHTSDKARASVLASMLARLRTADDLEFSQVVGLSMPKSDQLLLATLDALDRDGKVAVLEDICAAIEIKNAALKLVLRSLVTPMLIVPAAGVLAYMLSTGAIPIIEQIAPPTVWTPFNSAVRAMANFISSWGAFALCATVAAVLMIAYALPNWTHPYRFKMEKINPVYALVLAPVAPWLTVFSIYRDFQALDVITTLAVLLKRQQPLKQALEDIAKNGSPYTRTQLHKIIYLLDLYPLELARAFSMTILSSRVSARLATLVRTTSSFEHVLIEVGTTGSEDIRKQVGKAASTLNITLLVIAGGITFFLYMGQMNLVRSLKKEMDPTTMQMRALEAEQNQK